MDSMLSMVDCWKYLWPIKIFACFIFIWIHILKLLIFSFRILFWLGIFAFILTGSLLRKKKTVNHLAFSLFYIYIYIKSSFLKSKEKKEKKNNNKTIHRLLGVWCMYFSFVRSLPFCPHWRPPVKSTIFLPVHLNCAPLVCRLV